MLLYINGALAVCPLGAEFEETEAGWSCAFDDGSSEQPELISCPAE